MGALELLPPALKRHRIGADAYLRMAEQGLLPRDVRMELIDGEIIEMASIGTRHWATVNRLTRLMVSALGERAVVSVQANFRLDDFSQPEPDLGIFLPRTDFYVGALPRAADTLLLIEVADTSARYDRLIKLPLYARCGVPELWIVDLDAGVLRMYREPKGDDYLQATSTAQPGIVGIAALPGFVVDLTGVLG